MKLNFSNVEQLVFYDKGVQQILPEMTPIFQKWTLGVRAGLRTVAKDAVLDFFNNVTQEQLDRIGTHLGVSLSAQKMDRRLVKSFTTDSCRLVESLESDFQVSLAREGDLVYVCLWR